MDGPFNLGHLRSEVRSSADNACGEQWWTFNKIDTHYYDPWMEPYWLLVVTVCNHSSPMDGLGIGADGDL